jgi:DNA-binding Xre family transcriptional regulator
MLRGGGVMSDVSYKKLWKLLIDKDMRKKDLMEVAKISATSVAKMSKGENIQTDVLVKICKALQCDFADIMEIVTGESFPN